MQQAKKDAAKNWRATLSGGGAQMKNNVNVIQDEHRDHNDIAVPDVRDRGLPAEKQPAMGVHERAQIDRSVMNQLHPSFPHIPLTHTTTWIRFQPIPPYILPTSVCQYLTKK